QKTDVKLPNDFPLSQNNFVYNLNEATRIEKIFLSIPESYIKLRKNKKFKKTLVKTYSYALKFFGF
ncbi:hypothetical protein, partial [Caldisericum sp.]|uniref:hypothetical protein n=1 Tax=Caldisericum sp. TaxID=2499687 RepID=UPI003D0DE8A3